MRNTETMRCLMLAATFAAALLAAMPGAAQAQWKPEKNMEVVVGLAAGSFQDHTGRMIQKILQEQRLLGRGGTRTAPISTWRWTPWRWP